MSNELSDALHEIRVLKEQINNMKSCDNEVKDAMDVLRKHMKDKSEGELYHGWMCNIKWAVYDSIKSQSPDYKDFDSYLQNGCEEGAMMFLDRLLDKS